MRSRDRMSARLAAGLVAVSLLAVPAVMSAAAPDNGDGANAKPRLDFIFDKDWCAGTAAQTGTGTVGTPRLSRLSIRLYGGYSHILAKDINAGARGYFDLLELYAAAGATVTGRYKPLHGGSVFGADLIYQITPNIGLGVGAGFMRNSSSSAATVAFEGAETSITAKPRISAVPLRLGVFFNFPVARRIGLTADLGGDYYAGLKFDFTEMLSSDPTSWVELMINGSRSSLANLGFHGSLGVEFRIAPKVAFFVETVGRYAKFKNFDAVDAIANSSGSGSSSIAGKLYIATETGDFGFSTFTVSPTPPTDTASTTYREPKIDLSGFSLQAGFRLRF